MRINCLPVLAGLLLIHCGSVTLTGIVTCDTLPADLEDFGFQPTACDTFTAPGAIYETVIKVECNECHTQEYEGGPAGGISFDFPIQSFTELVFESSRDTSGSRINTASPAESLLLTKPLAASQAGSTSHRKGPQTWTTNSAQYLAIFQWIQDNVR